MTQKNVRRAAGCLAAALMMTVQSSSWASIQTSGPYQLAVVQNAGKAINYRKLKGSVDIGFKGTVLLPEAKGSAAMKNRAGVMEIKAEFEKISAPSQFGAEYYTYVLWAISPDGRAVNLGELVVEGGKSALQATIKVQTLCLLVTAEPYFAVSQPSSVVVLENVIDKDNKAAIEWVDANYELLPRGQYMKNSPEAEQAQAPMDKKTPFDLYQARNAVRIAKAAGADALDPEGFKNAERLLALAETKEGGKKGRVMTAREAVQAAEGSRLVAVKRGAQKASELKEEEGAAEISRAKADAASATQERLKAENAQLKAEKAQGQSDAERAAALGLAEKSAAASADSAAEAKSARAEAVTSKEQAELAKSQAAKAVGDQERLRAQLLQQLSLVLETRDSARGLIVNMSGVLFQTGSAELAPAAREKLAKVAGIVSAHPGLKLAVEGHADTTGGAASNQRLSERRAQAARDYLVSQGVDAGAVTARGFGMTTPLESNETPQGRQSNRRVEMVVTGDAIGTR